MVQAVNFRSCTRVASDLNAFKMVKVWTRSKASDGVGSGRQGSNGSPVVVDPKDGAEVEAGDAILIGVACKTRYGARRKLILSQER